MAATMSRPQNFPRTRQGLRNLDQPYTAAGRDPMPVNVGPDERMFSAVGGGALVAAGIARGGCLGLTMLFVGASLLMRGVTGHCPANEALGRNTA